MKEKILYLVNYLIGKLYRNKIGQSGAIKQILIVKLDEIGDMVYAMPVFDVLKQKFPEAKITVYCKAVASTLLENQKSVDEIVHVLNHQKVDIWIEMRGNFYTWMKSILFRPAFRLDRGTIRFRNKLKGSQKQELYTNLEIIQPILSSEEYASALKSVRPIIYTSAQNKIRAEFFLNKNEIDHYCVFHTGARDIARRWPMERFQELAHVIHTRLNLRILIVGGPEEAEHIQKLLPGFPSGTVSFCGAGSITDLKEICMKAAFFVGNESGPLHVAATCPIPVIGLFGPGVKDVFYPMGEWVSVIHYLTPDGKPLEGSQSSLLHISVAEVWGNIVKLLNQQAKHNSL